MKRTLEEWRDLKSQLLTAGNESRESLAKCRDRLNLTRQQAFRIMFGPEPAPSKKDVIAARREKVREIAHLPSRQVCELLGIARQTLREDLIALGLSWIPDVEATREKLVAAAKKTNDNRRKAALRGLEKARATEPMDRPNPPAPVIVPMATLQAARRMIGNGDRIEHVLQAMNLTIEPRRLRRLINNLR